MNKFIECVPNFSEGRDKNILKKIADSIKSVKGVKLLDIDPGNDTNRTVFTFIGIPDLVLEAAFRAIKTASELIDMRLHKGEHPRIGAADVCPLIPVTGVSEAECIKYANDLGLRVGTELGIPVYLYSKAAKKQNRIKLPVIRSGEYEGLKEKMNTPDFKPDFGPDIFNEKSGATVIGVRDFMLAYNINLNTREKSFAHEIALNLRESGRAKRDSQGNIIRDEFGKAVKVPGKLKYCQAAGWYIDEYGYAQVSMNLHNYMITGMHTAFEAVREEARKLGIRVTGSELIGLIPMQAILDAGEYFLTKQGINTDLSKDSIIHTAIRSLGLNDTSPFIPESRIVEYCMQDNNKECDSLVNMSIKDFSNLLASVTPAPGGGSVAALNGVLGSGLVSMVANLTSSKKKYEEYHSLMEDILKKSIGLKESFLRLIDEDTNAYNSFLKALRLPKKTSEEIEERKNAMESAAKTATEVPLETLKISLDLIKLSEQVIKKGNKNAYSDAVVSVLQARAAAEGAFRNITINLPLIKDEEYNKDVLARAESILKDIKQFASDLLKKEEIV